MKSLAKPSAQQSNVRKKIINPDKLLITNWIKVETTFVWVIKDFTDLKNFLEQTPIVMEFGHFKERENSNLMCTLEYSKNESKYYYGNIEEHRLIASLNILSTDNIVKLIICCYIVGRDDEKHLNTVHESGISAKTKKTITLFDINDNNLEGQRYLQNGTLTLAFLITELKFPT
ncbi:uncharacterized protein LOC122507802 [Leptopilina heterotoma]|uniref:uncharacterized protein LOC122507802 n=1 Tax=Leptopilina heterotoma TaxID=63436 RepID=UPI001CAA05E1|nr:uncharacterized protein LOC122507802 [Leptopilina heterotoma]